MAVLAVVVGLWPMVAGAQSAPDTARCVVVGAFFREPDTMLAAAVRQWNETRSPRIERQFSHDEAVELTRQVVIALLVDPSIDPQVAWQGILLALQNRGSVPYQFDDATMQQAQTAAAACG
jgi:hypothetical protein